MGQKEIKYLLFFTLAINAAFAQAQSLPASSPQSTLPRTSPSLPQPVPAADVPVHDPVMIRQDSIYYIYCTGWGISVWSSRDRKEWTKEPSVFSQPPQWAVAAIPGFKGHIWAPDISYHNGRYYLYYAVSTFGKNSSCIGLAINRTLHTDSPDYHWEDQGKVIQSIPGRDMWNAIDPNLEMDDNGTPWLAFGSFWNGIKLVRLNEDLRTPAQLEQWYTIAARPRSAGLPDTVAGDAAIEAPFLFKKDRYFYLFVSFDYCCRGEKSTYKMMVGRSEKIQGPYLDKDGRPMTQGGGSLVLEGDSNWYGVGHNAVVTFEDGDWLVFHGYDAHDKGKSKLRMEPLRWVDDWPVVKNVSQ